MAAFSPTIAHELLLEMLKQFALDSTFAVDIDANETVMVVSIPLIKIAGCVGYSDSK
jgi:hypothetical protein